MNSFVYISGNPGIGKFTIAKELQQLIPDSRIYHYHMIIEAMLPLASRSCPGYDEIRKAFLVHTLGEIATSPYTKHMTWIFTDTHDSPEWGRISLIDHNDGSDACGIPFIPIFLKCEMEENIRRATDPEHMERIDQWTVEKDNMLDMLRSQGEELKNTPRNEYLNELVLDVTELTAEEAALRIQGYVYRLTPDLPPNHPDAQDTPDAPDMDVDH